MSNAQIVVAEGQRSKNGEFLVRRLPEWMPKNPGQGNFKFLDVIGHEFDRLEDGIRDANNAATVQHAESVPQLERLGKLVDLPPTENEEREHYRSRLIAEFQSITSEGSISDILSNTATILDISPKKIRYSEPAENGVIKLDIPGDALEKISLDASDFVEVLGRTTAAGYRVEAAATGTFTFISAAAYEAGESDPDLGYDGLDTNGDPKDSGGTYAGLLQ